jgi:hypothetical protein
MLAEKSADRLGETNAKAVAMPVEDIALVAKDLQEKETRVEKTYEL